MHARFLIVALFAPVVAFAATIQSILDALIASLGAFVPIGVAVAVVVFIWGIVSFMYASGDEKSVEVGRQRMVWGIVAIFFIISVWGVVNVLQRMFDVGPINATNNCSAPTLGSNSATSCL